jgi:RNA polymerase sigma factor (sigma-70 family)
MTTAARADAAQLLYERYYPNVYRYALSQLRSPQDAEDAAQNTFLRAFAALQKGVRPENEVAWLFRIAHNVCASSKLAWLRRRRVEAPRDLDLLPIQPASPESRHDELAGLQDALADMPPRLREAFLLREWQGFSYAEIAERLDTSHSAVETLIFRARKHLAQSLERPARRVREALGLAPLLNFARGLFDATPVVVKAAGAVAILAGAGVAVQPLVAPNDSAPPAPAVSLPIAPAIVQPASRQQQQQQQQPQQHPQPRKAPAVANAAGTPRVPLTPGAPPVQAPADPGETPHASTPAASSPGKAAPSATAPLVSTPPVPSVTAPVLPVTTPALPSATTPALPPTPTPALPVAPPLETPAVPTGNVPDLPTVPTVTVPRSVP